MDEKIDKKHFKLEPLNVNNFIKVNDLTKISNPMFFSRDNAPTADGLLSNEIFGVTKDDRISIFAYIELSGETFMHPLAYKIWCRLDSNVKMCVYEMDTYSLDESTGKLKSDPNGENGIKFLKKIINKINFKKTDSAKRQIKIDFLESYKDKLFMENLIVIPAGFRDVNTDTNNRIGVGEINKLYNAIIRDTNALKESEDYGLSLNGSIRGRIQDNIVKIYDWFVFGRFEGQDSQASGLSRKLGLIRRAGMKKSFDYGARLVIAAQNLRKEKVSDIAVDLDSIGLPLAAVCANLYPYMIFWLRNWFDNQFSELTSFPVYKNGKVINMELAEYQDIYSDERIKKELDRFMHGMGNRFIAIEAPVKGLKNGKLNGKNVSLLFKGYNNISDDEYKDFIENKTGKIKHPIMERPLTWCDLIFQAATEVTKDKMTLITRYPMDLYWNQFPAKIKVFSTIETEPMIINNTYYKDYPKIRISDIGENSSNKFIDVAIPNNVRLGSIGGDFDGDTVSSKVTYTIEANDELKKLINSKRHYIGLSGTNDMSSTNEGLQALYNLTLVLSDNEKELTEPSF